MPLLLASLALPKDWAFSRDLFLIVPPKMLAAHLPFLHALLWGMNCRLSVSLTAISCHFLSSTLSHPELLVGRVMYSISRTGGRGDRIFFWLPVVRAWQPWEVGQRDSRDTMRLHFAEQDQTGAAQCMAPGCVQVSQNQHLGTIFSLVPTGLFQPLFLC